MKIHVGTSGFGYKEWKGKFYPEKISPKEMLRFYSERFGTVEINNTFYHMPTESVLQSWAEQVPDDFVFAFKAPQVITHLKRLKHVDEETEYLFRTLSVLEGKLGPVLFQFPKSFHADLPALDLFSRADSRHGLLRLRVPQPHLARRRNSRVSSGKGDAACASPTPMRIRQRRSSRAATWGYLRLRRSDYTDADLAQWLERIRSQKWKRAFVFFKHEDEAKGPEAAMRFQELPIQILRGSCPGFTAHPDKHTGNL